MGKDKPYKFYRITKQHIFWSLVPGIILALIIYPQTFISLNLTLYFVLYSSSIGILFQKSNEYFEMVVDERIPWLKQPGKRLVVTSAYQLLLGVCVLFIVNFVFYIFIRKATAQTFLQESFIATKYVVISIVVAIPVSNSFMFFKSWKQSVLNEEKLKRDKLSMEYEALKNQVNPHFFFNSLTALISLVRVDQEKAIQFIEHFSKIFRYRLEHHQNQLVDLSIEKQIVESITMFYQIRFENEIKFNVNLHDTQNKCIVPMALQMLVENAVKHNSASIDKPLNIDIWLNGNYVIVKNNLQLKRSGVVSNRLGLKNIQSQYKYFTKNEVVIEKTGESFIVKLPLLDKA